MTNGSLPDGRRLSKFSNADRSPYSHQPSQVVQTDQENLEQPAPPDLALTEIIEHVIRDGHVASSNEANILTEPRHEETPTRSYSNIDLRSLHHAPSLQNESVLSSKLFEELQAVHDYSHATLTQSDATAEALFTQTLPLDTDDPDDEKQRDQEIVTAIADQLVAQQQSAAASKSKELTVAEPAKSRRKIIARYSSISLGYAQSTAKTSAIWISKGGRIVGKGLLKFARANQIIDWHRRYFNFVAFVHRRLFDGRVERLLFIKSAPPSAQSETSESFNKKRFSYRGPYPRLALDWAFSILPADLKHFAFIDFRAGNGRSLLLATRRNFDYAAGYTFSQQTCEELEMNLSQYPRSYMACRDVRALRGDLEGIAIPPQPLVLFFPAGIRDAHLSIILSHVSASYRLSRRPIYLIFEHVEHGYKIEYEDVFKRLSLPAMLRLKISLLSPARTIIYYSSETAAQG